MQCLVPRSRLLPTDMMDADFVREFPMLLPLLSNEQPSATDGTVYDGFINAAGMDFRLQLHLPSSVSLQGLEIRGSWMLKQLLQKHAHFLQQCLRRSPSLLVFLQELRNVVSKQLKCDPYQVTQPSPPSFYAQLLSDIEILGWEKLVYIDAEFADLHFQLMDEEGRRHLLKLKIPPQYPRQPPQYVTDLPEEFYFHWSQKSHLCDVYQQFTNVVRSYQTFWKAMDELDTSTWVLEPELPQQRDVQRRIAIGRSASVQVTVDPREPDKLPEVKFLGADHMITPLREALGRNLQLWDPAVSILENLQRTLEVSFPSPQTSTREELSVECSICYAYRLEGEIPSKICEDVRCAQPFHQSCLYEWLRTLSTSRQSLNTIFGECPNCSKAISCKMPG